MEGLPWTIPSQTSLVNIFRTNDKSSLCSGGYLNIIFQIKKEIPAAEKRNCFDAFPQVAGCSGRLYAVLSFLLFYFLFWLPLIPNFCLCSDTQVRVGDNNANILDVMIKFDDYHINLETKMGTDSPETTQLDRTIVTYGLDMKFIQ